MKNKGVVFSVGILILAIIYLLVSSFGEKNNEDKLSEDNKVDVSEEVQHDGSDMEMMDVEKSIDAAMKGDLSAKVGVYDTYAPEKIAEASNNGDVLLFFHASWCTSCRALEKDILENVGNIPDGVTILKTDYDSNSELKKKYGVRVQHTFVQVDKDGNKIKMWSGGNRLQDVLKNI